MRLDLGIAPSTGYTSPEKSDYRRRVWADLAKAVMPNTWAVLMPARGGPRNEKEASEAGAEVPRFATQKWIEPFISSDLDAALKSPIIFTPPAGNIALTSTRCLCVAF